MLTISTLENGSLELSDDGEKLVGKFHGDGSGKLVDNHARRYPRLQAKYGKRQLYGAIQSAVRDGSSTLEAL